jgi:Uncharacterised nucleotidyltransferase
MSRGRMAPLGTGETIAAILFTAWRTEPNPIPEAVAHRLPDVAAKLLETGCGALAWWRLRNSSPEAEDGAGLRQAYRLHALEAVRHEQAFHHVLVHFNEAGLFPIVFKGWTLTGFYARPCLRPYGDIDILVSQGDEPAARSVLARLAPELSQQVDLDMRVLERFLPDRSFESLRARATTQAIGTARFTALSPEDHLRLVCLHQLDHGGWRPLWLTDVAAFVEGLPPGFDWKRCLEGNVHLSDGVVALLALAEELLGARLPEGAPRRPAPAWFREAVLRGWAEGFHAPPASLYELRQLGWRRGSAALRQRWPDPISSTLHLRAPFRGIPRVVLQLAECGRRAALFLHRTWRDGPPSSPSAVAEHRQGVPP